MESAAESSKLVLLSNFLASQLLSVSLESLWGAIEAQQLMILLPLCDVVLPSNTISYFESIFSLASFAIDSAVGNTSESILGLEASAPFKQNFEELEISSIYTLTNMGTMTLVYLSFPLLVLLQMAIGKWCKQRHLKAYRVNKSLKRSLYFSYVLRATYEGYSVIALSTMIGLTAMSYDSFGLTVQAVFSLVSLCLLVIGPYLLLAFLAANFNNLTASKFKQRFGTFYENLRLATGRKVLLHPGFFLFRRLVLTFALVVFRDNFFAQLVMIWL